VFLPADGFLPSTLFVKNASAHTNTLPLPPSRPRGRADASERTLAKKNKKNWVVVACWKREEKNVQFSVINPHDP
jgi:hypothetical protein